MSEEISVNPQLARLVVGIILESSGSEEAIGLLVDHCSLVDLGLVRQRLILERGDPTRRTELFEQLGSVECVELLELATMRAQGGKDYQAMSAPHSREVWRRVMDRIRRPSTQVRIESKQGGEPAKAQKRLGPLGTAALVAVAVMIPLVAVLVALDSDDAESGDRRIP